MAAEHSDTQPTGRLATPAEMDDLFGASPQIPSERRGRTVGRDIMSILGPSGLPRASSAEDTVPDEENAANFKREPVEPTEFISPGQAQNILNYRPLRKRGGMSEGMPLCSEDLVGYGYDGRTNHWPSSEVRRHALDGFNAFMSVFTADAVAKLGPNAPPPTESPDFHVFGTTDGAFEILFGDDYRQKHEGVLDFDNPALPTVQYQGITKRYKPFDRHGEPRRWAGFQEFLHFSTQGEVMARSPDFDEQVRLYLNPIPEATAAVTAEICQGFIARYGYMPHGKFMEDATANRVEERDDRLLFYLRSPEELTAVLQLTSDIQKRRPELFAGREAILTGEPVIVNGQELATARLAQQPHLDEDGFERSFNEVIVDILKTGIYQTFDAAYIDNPSPQDVANFIERLKELAPRFGRNLRSISFNEGQDMDVIHSAVNKVQ